ncbi:hypothetical protein ABK040_006832 [Willaertia magna]
MQNPSPTSSPSVVSSTGEQKETNSSASTNNSNVFSFKTSYTFNGEDCNVYFTTPDDQTFLLTIENKLTYDRWSARYNSEQIKALTEKSNSPKQFPTFVKMIYQTLIGKSTSVTLELLQKHQVELLISKKRPKNDNKPLPSLSSDVRYLIVVYFTEYDSVRYPLPMIYEPPNIELLKSVIRELRLENQRLKKPSKDKGENKEKKEIEEELRRIQVESANEIRHLRKQYEELIRELNGQKNLEKEKLHAQLKEELKISKEYKEKYKQSKKELQLAKEEIELLKSHQKNSKSGISSVSSSRRSSSPLPSSRTRSPSPKPKVSRSPRISSSPSEKKRSGSVERRSGSTKNQYDHSSDYLKRQKQKPPLLSSTNSSTSGRKTPSPSVNNKGGTRSKSNSPSVGRSPKIPSNSTNNGRRSRSSSVEKERSSRSNSRSNSRPNSRSNSPSRERGRSPKVVPSKIKKNSKKNYYDTSEEEYTYTSEEESVVGSATEYSTQPEAYDTNSDYSSESDNYRRSHKKNSVKKITYHKR